MLSRMPTKRNQATSASALVDALFTLMPNVVSHINERLADLDITNTELWAIRTIEGPMPMKELAHCMDFDPSYVTVVADRLESRGLVERTPHPTDRRVKNLVLTAKGEQLKASAPELVWSGENIFDALTAAERHQLLDLVTKLTADREAHDD